jgi:hypothetical protein
LDDAPPAGRYQAAAELHGFLARAERAYQGAVKDALVAEISSLDQRKSVSQQ